MTLGFKWLNRWVEKKKVKVWGAELSGAADRRGAAVVVEAEVVVVVVEAVGGRGLHTDRKG